MKNYFLIPCLLLGSVASLSQQPPAEPKREGANTLLDSDRVQIREAQLALAQAHIARLQAEVQVKEQLGVIQAQEKRLTDLIESLKKQYACSNCELAVDFTWVKKPAPSEAKAPAPEKSGQTSKKE
jgi:hypothetical protein